jgi:hypothetical protein
MYGLAQRACATPKTVRPRLDACHGILASLLVLLSRPLLSPSPSSRSLTTVPRGWARSGCSSRRAGRMSAAPVCGAPAAAPPLLRWAQGRTGAPAAACVGPLVVPEGPGCGDGEGAAGEPFPPAAAVVPETAAPRVAEAMPVANHAAPGNLHPLQTYTTIDCSELQL